MMQHWCTFNTDTSVQYDSTTCRHTTQMCPHCMCETHIAKISGGIQVLLYASIANIPVRYCKQSSKAGMLMHLNTP